MLVDIYESLLERASSIPLSRELAAAALESSCSFRILLVPLSVSYSNQCQTILQSAGQDLGLERS